MKISIIIPCLNEESFLPNLLDDLKKQTVSIHEIIIIDAYSTDQTLDKIKKYKDIKIFQAQPNIGNQRSLGGQKATGDFLFFFDADVRMQPSFLEESIMIINKKKLKIASFVYTPYRAGCDGKIYKSKTSINATYFMINYLIYFFQLISPSGAGSGIFVNKAVFDRSTGFRSDLKFDDIEFIRRCAKKNKFRVIRKKLFVSDRRFARYGVLKTALSYLLLSIFFIFNAFKTAEIVEYNFAQYSNQKTNT